MSVGGFSEKWTSSRGHKVDFSVQKRASGGYSLSVTEGAHTQTYRFTGLSDAEVERTKDRIIGILKEMVDAEELPGAAASNIAEGLKNVKRINFCREGPAGDLSVRVKDQTGTRKVGQGMFVQKATNQFFQTLNPELNANYKALQEHGKSTYDEMKAYLAGKEGGGPPASKEQKERWNESIRQYAFSMKKLISEDGFSEESWLYQSASHRLEALCQWFKEATGENPSHPA